RKTFKQFFCHVLSHFLWFIISKNLEVRRRRRGRKKMSQIGARSAGGPRARRGRLRPALRPRARCTALVPAEKHRKLAGIHRKKIWVVSGRNTASTFRRFPVFSCRIW